ncbi:phosphatase PAP2 family protein, partial [Acinetobacter baumannii]|uniref:phosphatase PAP2 family protein n=1 Tax=Acinetobacter baumannii TaxID=470 RepID=UPI0012373A32
SLLIIIWLLKLSHLMFEFAMLCHKHNINSPYIVLISCLWFVCMGLSRIYAGVHFPTDVLAGWGIGFIWIALLWLWLLQTQSRLSRKQIYF